MKSLPFSPNAAVTGIGSLPMTDPMEAVQFIETTCPEIPFWPQLPQRAASETMVAQVLGPLKPFLKPADSASRFGYDVRDGMLSDFTQALDHVGARLDEQHAAGFFAFQKALQGGAFQNAVALKGQQIGPLTLSGLLFLKGQPILHNLELTQKVTHYLERIACWQIDQLKAYGKPVLIFFDEPGLGVLAKKELRLANALLNILRTCLENLGSRGAFTGLHCCASVPYKLMCEVEPDIISFDADQDLATFLEEPAAMIFLKKGGSVAFGLVPTQLKDRSFNIEETYLKWKTELQKDFDFASVAKRSFITASCGV
ncbi:MAG: hypothetical protein HGB11_10880, partial [Chlorobiales bacterium]|nr:hypothetical protein [Chlorobiales bacterium]